MRKSWSFTFFSPPPAVILLPPCPASLTLKNSQGHEIFLWDVIINQSKKCFKRMPCLHDLKYVLRATSKQESNTVHS